MKITTGYEKSQHSFNSVLFSHIHLIMIIKHFYLFADLIEILNA